MKTLYITALSAMVLMTGFTNCAQSQQKQNAKAATKPVSKDNDNDDWQSFNSRHTPGTWDAAIRDESVNIQFYGEHWSNGRNFQLAELGTLPTGNVGTFTVNREAGKMTFKGVFEGGFGHGNYTFQQNDAFKSYLQERGYKDLDEQMMMAVFFTNINKGYFEYMKANGYASISAIAVGVGGLLARVDAMPHVLAELVGALAHARVSGLALHPRADGLLSGVLVAEPRPLVDAHVVDVGLSETRKALLLHAHRAHLLAAPIGRFIGSENA